LTTDKEGIMDKATHYTVIGAGHGGKAMAAHLAMMGLDVTLYNRTAANVEPIKLRKGIDLESYDGGPHGFGRLAMVTSDMGEALAQANVVMVVVPSSAHADIARAAAPHLRDGQIVLLHPGRTLGTIEFVHVLRQNGCPADVTVAEAETFIYASRSDGPAQAHSTTISAGDWPSKAATTMPASVSSGAPSVSRASATIRPLPSHSPARLGVTNISGAASASRASAW
jgi:ketopantoate reductase